MLWYSSAVLAVVCNLYFCMSHTSIASEWLNKESWKQHCTIAQGLYFSGAKDLGEIRMGGHPNGGAKCRWGRLK